MKKDDSTVPRFSRKQRWEHHLVMVSFTLLALTGFPQKYFEAGLSRDVVRFLGGFDTVRLLHRTAGFVFVALTAWHLLAAIVGVLRRRQALTLVPTRKDFSDAVTQLRYYFGLEERGARFDRYDYRQKFEYWGMVIGSLVMVVTGLVLVYPIAATRFLPGELVPVARVTHSNEGLMALLVVITWHIFNAHLSPEVFPFDTSIFTGRISRHRMAHEHPLELERMIERGEVPDEIPEAEAADREVAASSREAPAGS